MYLSYEEMFVFAQQPLPCFLYVFPQGKSCVGIDFIDCWFVTFHKLLPLGIKNIKNSSFFILHSSFFTFI